MANNAANPKILAVIPARGGSKGIRRKNLVPVGGKPLIQWTIDTALECSYLDCVCVSSDDPEIISASRQAGADVPFTRPAVLATDTADTAGVVRHALDWYSSSRGTEYDYVALLQPTSPFRAVSDIAGTVLLALEQNADVAMSVTESHENPYLMRKMDSGGMLMPFMETDVKHPRRQDLPSAYFINGAVYVAGSQYLQQNDTFYPPRPLGYVMPAERSLQIDGEWDLKLARLIAEDRT